MLRQPKFVAIAVAGALAILAGGTQAAEEKVTRALEKPLKAANEAMQAKKGDECLARAHEAQAIEGRTAYDNFVINELIGACSARLSKFQDAYTALAANANSPQLANKGLRYLALAQLSYNLKDYPNSVEWGSKALESGQDNGELRVLIAQSYYLQKKYKEACTSMQEVVGRAEKSGQRPTESSLALLFQCYDKLSDEGNRGRIIDKLVAYYPKPDYWLNAMVTLQQAAQKNDRLLLQVYRLMADVGAIKSANQFGEMASLAMEQGFPGEAQSVLELAMSKNVFEDQREKAKYTRMLESARKGVASEKANVASAETEAARTGNSDLLVAVGSSYLLNAGDPAKAAALISQGLTKGSLQKIPVNDADITLGIAYTRAKNTAEAQKAFGRVDKDNSYERLAKLWSLRAR